MRIIMHGDKNLLKGIRRFKCKACGCIFEADNTEYKYQYSQREMCSWYEIKCPTCDSWVTINCEEVNA